MNIPSKGQAVAFGRHVVSYGMGAVTVLAVTHVVSPDQAHSATDAINQISSGLASVIAGLTTLISIGSALWAGMSASLKSQVAAVQASPTAQVITSDPKLAAAVPGVKVGTVQS